MSLPQTPKKAPTAATFLERSRHLVRVTSIKMLHPTRHTLSHLVHGGNLAPRIPAAIPNLPEGGSPVDAAVSAPVISAHGGHWSKGQDGALRGLPPSDSFESNILPFNWMRGRVGGPLTSWLRDTSPRPDAGPEINLKKYLHNSGFLLLIGTTRKRTRIGIAGRFGS